MTHLEFWDRHTDMSDVSKKSTEPLSEWILGNLWWEILAWKKNTRSNLNEGERAPSLSETLVGECLEMLIQGEERRNTLCYLIGQGPISVTIFLSFSGVNRGWYCIWYILIWYRGGRFQVFFKRSPLFGGRFIFILLKWEQTTCHVHT